MLFQNIQFRKTKSVVNDVNNFGWLWHPAPGIVLWSIKLCFRSAFLLLAAATGYTVNSAVFFMSEYVL